jgi:hypothetical protein
MYSTYPVGSFILHGMLIVQSFDEFAMGPIYYPDPEETSPYYDGEIGFISEANANSMDRWELPTFNTDPVFDHNLPLNYNSSYSAPQRGFQLEASPTYSEGSSSSQAPSSKSSYDDYTADPVYDPVCDPVCIPAPLMDCVSS